MKKKYYVEMYSCTTMECLMEDIKTYGHNEYVMVDDNWKEVSPAYLAVHDFDDSTVRLLFITDEEGYKKLPLDEIDDFIAVTEIDEEDTLEIIISDKPLKKDYVVWHYTCPIEDGKIVI